MVAGAAPPASMIEGMEQMGFDLTHVYGLTEVYGPATVCAGTTPGTSLDIGERARLNARQGVRYHLQRAAMVLDPRPCGPCRTDGETMGEIMFRSNIAMKGYLKNPAPGSLPPAAGSIPATWRCSTPTATSRSKDRSKDIIISGGETSPLKWKTCSTATPTVMACAVVAKPDPKWGETPCAFVGAQAGALTTVDDIVQHCKSTWLGFKVPRLPWCSANCRRPAPARSRSLS